MEETRGCISDIIPFSLNDGPGIRTTVFFKGCPLHCLWCHNPETQAVQPQNLYTPEKCIHCGACAVCPEKLRKKDGQWECDGTGCNGCGTCTAVCSSGANKRNGKMMTPKEVLHETVQDRIFYETSGGGVTFSGGEPLMQGRFLYETVKLHAEAGIHTILETSGFGKWSVLESILPYISTFYFDWKVTDPELHKKFTGADNRLIRQNLERLNMAGTDIVLRCPIIPGCNDTPEHFRGIGKLTHEMSCIRQVDVLPYHPIGNDKRKKLGLMPDGFVCPDETGREEWRAAIAAECCVAVTI